MEDIVGLVVDIDSGDKNNPQAVTEYVNDIYAYYKKVEVQRLLLNFNLDKYDVYYKYVNDIIL